MPSPEKRAKEVDSRTAREDNDVSSALPVDRLAGESASRSGEVGIETAQDYVQVLAFPKPQAQRKSPNQQN
jgi:hypothetical protein